MSMSSEEALRREWLAFEKELGFRPLLYGPTYEDFINQDTKNGEALMKRYHIASPDQSVKTTWHETSSGVRLKSYVPPTISSDKPLVYFIHGGGFVIGSVDEDDRFVNRHSKDTGCLFVSVEYRLAPKHKYPKGLEDCVEGAKWCIENARRLGAKAGPIIVMGKSAGGSLALAVALKLIDEGRGGDVLGVAPCQPITIHPDAVPEEFQDRYTSFDENAENTVNTKKAMYAFYELHGAPLDDPYIWSLQHPNLKALPRVYQNCCGADTLRDDARLMKELLDKNDVPNRLEEYEKLPHYFFAFPSPQLDGLRNEYFAKTARGIEWLISDGEDWLPNRANI